MRYCVNSISRLNGTVVVRGDKSISHRALMLGAIARGVTEITGCAPGEDVRSTQRCLSDLGVSIDRAGDDVRVTGRGLGGLAVPDRFLDAGNSGTTARLLTGILAAQEFESVLTGDDSLRRRPMRRVLDPVRLMGARVDAAPEGRLPIRIHGNHLQAIDHELTVPSAQVKSCVLLAGLHAAGETSVAEPTPSRDHTERMFSHLGIEVRRAGRKISVVGPVQPSASDIDVPGDFSSAAFFIVAGILVPDSEIRLPGVGTNPTRTGLLALLRKMGAEIGIENERVIAGEPRADLTVRSYALRGAIVEPEQIPALIDEIPLIAVAATQAEGETVVRNARELRVKESDRIEAIAENLRAMGIRLEVFEDGFAIHGPQKLRGATITSHGDHRIAMAFAVAGLIAEGTTVIDGAERVEISYPGFFQALEELA